MVALNSYKYKKETIMNKKFHYLYKITRFDGMFYIGVHSTDNLDDGYLGSGIYIKRSVEKYGKDAHSKEILEFCNDRKTLLAREKELVSESLINQDSCMNMRLGGVGGFENTDRKKIAQTIKERYGDSFYKDIASIGKGNMPDSQKNKIRDASIKNGSGKSNKGLIRQKYKCHHCEVVAAMNILKRWHLDNCKNFTSLAQR